MNKHSDKMTLKRSGANGVLPYSYEFPNTMDILSSRNTFCLCHLKHSAKCCLRDTMIPGLPVKKLRLRDNK